MKVAISFFNSIIGGPREVTINLLKYLPDVDKNINYIVLTDSITGLEFLNHYSNVEMVILKKYNKYDLLYWEQVSAYLNSRKEKIDVFHGTKNSIPLLGNFKKICTIHDLAYYIMPSTFSFFQRVHLKISAYIAKYFSHRIVAVSKNTKKDIVDILTVNSKKVEVIYNAINEEFYSSCSNELKDKVSTRFWIDYKFFLHVGTLQPRKNISTIIDAFVEFKKTDTEDYHLVLAGRKGWYFDEISDYIHKSGVAEFVIFTGPVSHEELITLYHLAYLFIYASNYDGFGLVPLEAMATGCPTICSNISSLPEVVEDAAVSINPKDSTSIYEAMKLLVSSKDKYEQYSAAGILQAKKFSWRKSAEEYVEMYKNICK